MFNYYKINKYERKIDDKPYMIPFNNEFEEYLNIFTNKKKYIDFSHFIFTYCLCHKIKLEHRMFYFSTRMNERNDMIFKVEPTYKFNWKKMKKIDVTKKHLIKHNIPFKFKNNKYYLSYNSFKYFYRDYKYFNIFLNVMLSLYYQYINWQNS